MQKKSKVKIIIITIVLLIIISILAYISAWLVYYFSFNKYTKSVPFNNSEQYYGYVLQEDDGYIYSVFKPDFMDFRGEISITKQIILSSDPENAVPFDCCEFLIFPSLNGKYEIWVTVSFYDGLAKKDEEEPEYYSTAPDESYSFDLDSKLNLISDNTKENQELLNKYMPMILETYKKMYDKWGIGDETVISQLGE